MRGSSKSRIDEITGPVQSSFSCVPGNVYQLILPSFVFAPPGHKFFQGRDWSGETRGNRKERDHPTLQERNTLLFDFLPFEWPLLLWPLSLADGVLVAQTLLFFQTQRPHHFRNHTSIWNSFPLQEPKAKKSKLSTAHPINKMFLSICPQYTYMYT